MSRRDDVDPNRRRVELHIQESVATAHYLAATGADEDTYKEFLDHLPLGMLPGAVADGILKGFIAITIEDDQF